MRLIEAFYEAARDGAPSPVPRETLIAVAQWCDQVEGQMLDGPH